MSTDKALSIDGQTVVVGESAEHVAEVRKLRHGVVALIYRCPQVDPTEAARAAWQAAGGGAR